MTKNLRTTKIKYFFQNSKSKCRYLSIKAFVFNMLTSILTLLLPFKINSNTLHLVVFFIAMQNCSFSSHCMVSPSISN